MELINEPAAAPPAKNGSAKRPAPEEDGSEEEEEEPKSNKKKVSYERILTRGPQPKLPSLQRRPNQQQPQVVVEPASLAPSPSPLSWPELWAKSAWPATK